MIRLATILMAALCSAIGLAGAEPALDLHSATTIVAQLDSGEIGPGFSDTIIDRAQPAITVMQNGQYTIFHLAGLDDTTDGISLMSYIGKLFFAHYAACSDS
jgi:hypothetical protein